MQELPDPMIPKKLIISAPFGNYLWYVGATRTLGTFTLFSRRNDQFKIGPDGSRFYSPENQGSWWAGMLWRAVTTIRYKKRLGGWVNRMGLRNPGIYSLCPKKSEHREYLRNHIVSVHGFNFEEWKDLWWACRMLDVGCVELNFSCPNVGEKQEAMLQDMERVVKYILEARSIKDPRFIVKLSPLNPIKFVDKLMTLGAELDTLYVHLCNTTPCDYGGLSGQKHVDIVQAVHAKYPGLVIIAGGGVRSIQDAYEYMLAGAQHVAVASAFFNPFFHRRFQKMVKWSQGRFE